MPFCPDCGTQVSEDTRFCPECGRGLAIGQVVIGQAVKGKSKKKLAGIIVACVIAIIVVIVLLLKPPTYTLTVSISPSGAGSTSPSGGEYQSGRQVTLTAIPASGYTFDHWSGSASGTASSITITMDSDKSITANFKTTTYTLTTNISPSGAGFIYPSSGEYESGMQVTMTASPASGYTFDYWSGSASDTTSAITITMDSDKSITAHFKTTPTAPEVLFSDDFSDESSGWVTYDEYDGRVIYRDGYLCIKDYEPPEGTMYGECQRYFTDFILEVETWLVGGTDDNWHSVTCRCQDDYKSYYDFGISADGYYEILKFVNGNRIVVVSPTYSSYIHKGQGLTNLIHIECIGSSLSLSVNGHLLEEVTDATFSSGDIGLSAAALTGTFTEVAFDNIVVSEP